LYRWTAAWPDRKLTRPHLGLTDLILCEILQGIPTEGEAARTLKELRRFAVFANRGVELAAAAARNYRALRTRGRTVRKTINFLIATFCLVHLHSLLHRDRNFDPFEDALGLQVVHSWRHAANQAHHGGASGIRRQRPGEDSAATVHGRAPFGHQPFRNPRGACRRSPTKTDDRCHRTLAGAVGSTTDDGQ
jgi:predicted nucleic acid-binding protein